MFSCGSKKKAISTTTEAAVERNESVTENPYKVTVKANENSSRKNNRTTTSTASNEANAIIKTALNYSGTPYKYGGTTKHGMDCSGLIYVSFKEHEIDLQRASYMMATQGKEIKLKEVEKGDLLFFTTGRSKKKINHVGLVVDIKEDDIKFIHSTTSRGVLVSSLSEGYWNYAFHHARRIL
ncbi:C40 family peptidase [Joostella sp. CR20]